MAALMSIQEGNNQAEVLLVHWVPAIAPLVLLLSGLIWRALLGLA